MSLPTFRLTKKDLHRFDEAIQKEWLLTNGLGGYASSTVLGINTRKYHGLLVAALHPPGDRTVCLAKLDEEISFEKKIVQLGANQFNDVFYPEGFRFLEEFSVSPFPRFVYKANNIEVGKTIFLPHEKNVAVTMYNVLNKGNLDATLRITPLVTCRHFHQTISKSDKSFRFIQKQNNEKETQIEFDQPKATLLIRSTQGNFKLKPNWIDKLYYQVEAQRGESSVEDCFQPGYFEVSIQPDVQVDFSILATLGASSQQAIESLSALGFSSVNVEQTFIKELKRREAFLGSFYDSYSTIERSDWLSWVILAADSFIVKGFGDRKSVIAGYHWFEAWGRDTFISLPGLMLATHRFDDARKVLLGFNKFCTLGLIPNFLSDLSLVPSCNTVDATMWYVNAVLQYLKYTNDFRFVQDELWDSLKEIVENHVEGTSFGIRVDEDGLLSHGPRLTWMDADVNGKAITPRAGKAVEIQALWYNALQVVRLIAAKLNEEKLAESYDLLAKKAKGNFVKEFWNNQKDCLFDVLTTSGPDASIRPNQVIASALDFSMLDNSRIEKVVDLVEMKLLTPCGLRTLARDDANYKSTCIGDRWIRDEAYHNGTVWPWLIGPFATAFLKAKGNDSENRRHAFQNFVQPLFTQQIQRSCFGTVNEIFDGDLPHFPRGCVSQAWSVAEPLRAYLEDILQIRPKYEKEVLSV